MESVTLWANTLHTYDGKSSPNQHIYYFRSQTGNVIDNDARSNHDEEEHFSNDQPKAEKSKEGSSLDAEVLKGLQAQIASLAQRDELKKVGAVCPYPLE